MPSIVQALVFQLTLPVWGATLSSTVFDTESVFQLTLPVWGATNALHDGTSPRQISTHAPRVGSDRSVTLSGVEADDFNSRSPCGERPRPPACSMLIASFQLTLPVWGATSFVRIQRLLWLISTHAPRVGSDLSILVQITLKHYFNSRSPCGERLRHAAKIPRSHIISTHAPRVGSD